MNSLKSTFESFDFQKLKRFAKKHWLLICGSFGFSALAVGFGFTFLADAIYFNDPRHKDEALKSWMTPRYIMLSYELPRSEVLDVLGLTGQSPSRAWRMREVARSQGITMSELTIKVREAANTYRENQQLEEEVD